MAANTNEKERAINPFLLEIEDNLSRFLENISCLRETYEDTERTLLNQNSGAEKKFNELIKNFPIDEETGDMEIPVRHYREFQKRERHRMRTERALSLVPQSYLVSLVSLYDQFYAGLIKLIYRIDPDKLKENKKPFTYKDLCEYQNVQEVKVVIVDETIEDRLRDSHVKQFEWLAGAMDLNTLKGFKEWPDFVELTERRNLFVHSDGVVSQQYINVCKSEKAYKGDIKKGSQLKVDKEYFEKAFKTLYVVGIKLTQMLCHTVYDKQYPNEYADMDKLLINNIYELIAEELYDVAISVSEFAHDDHFMKDKHNGHDKCFILLNYAQAYKWNGQDDECQKLLAATDCTTWKDELLIPKLTLEGKFDQVYAKMRTVGRGSDILTAENCRQWPIFKEIRKEDAFVALFKEIFDEDLETSIQRKVESTITYIDTDNLIEMTDQIKSGEKDQFFFFFNKIKDRMEGEDEKDKEEQ